MVNLNNGAIYGHGLVRAKDFYFHIEIGFNKHSFGDMVVT